MTLAIASFYQKNQQQFQQSAKIKLGYVLVQPTDMTMWMPPVITPEQLQTLYEQRKESAEADQEVNLRHILVANSDSDEQTKQERIAQVRKALETQDFALVAERYSLDNATTANGGSLGDIAINLLPQSFQQALINMNPSSIHDEPLESDSGIHFIKLETRNAVNFPAFSALKTELRAQLVAQKQR